MLLTYKVYTQSTDNAERLSSRLLHLNNIKFDNEIIYVFHYVEVMNGQWNQYKPFISYPLLLAYQSFVYVLIFFMKRNFVNIFKRKIGCLI